MLLSTSVQLCRLLKNSLTRVCDKANLSRIAGERFDGSSTVPHISTVKPYPKWLAQANHRELIATVLEDYKMYNTHFFIDGPERLSESRLQSLSALIQKAVKSQDIAQISKLGKDVPSDASQLEYLRREMKSSGFTPFSIALSEHITQLTARLQANFRNEKLTSAVATLYYSKWFLSHDGNISSVVSSFDQMIKNQQQHIDVPSWCHFMQWRITITSNFDFSELCDLFVGQQMALKCRSITDLVAVISLMESCTAKLHNRKAFIEACMRPILANQQLIFKDINLMAVICKIERSSPYHEKWFMPNPKFVYILWNVLVNHMSSHQELSTAVMLCIDVAAKLMHPGMLKDRHIFDKTFSSIGIIAPKILRFSPATGVKVFNGMVHSHHVDINMAEQFIESFRHINWTKEDFAVTAKAVNSLADYGCVKPSVYKPMLEFIMNHTANNTSRVDYEAIITILLGLSYIQIFPENLYTLLFNALHRMGAGNRHLSKYNYLQKVVSLDGTLPILSSYKGPRLLEGFIKEAREIIPKTEGIWTLAGTPSHPKMVTTILHCVNAIPSINAKYIAQRKVVLKHFDIQDILLTSLSQSRRNVVITILDDPFFRSLYKDKYDTSPRLQLIGWHRSRLLQLTKLGYVVVPIIFNDYMKRSDKSQLIFDKLQAAVRASREQNSSVTVV